MQIDGKERYVVESDVRVFFDTNLSQACHLRAVLQSRPDAAMEGSPLYQVLHDLDSRIRQAQTTINTYVKALSEIDLQQRNAELQASLQSAKECVDAHS
tara:strand:+ start:793 stop:1089 length:297 start_codon:yes stop_codon:yes gene_type:complete